MGFTPLHITIQSDSILVFQALLSLKTIDVNAKTRSQATPLILTAFHRRYGMLKALLSSVVVNAQDERGKLGLSYRCAQPADIHLQYRTHCCSLGL
jgi:ankyrin repeat protein